MSLTKAELRQNGLYRETKTIIIPASDIVENAINITAQRGNVQAVSLVVVGGTDLEYSEVTFTLSDNGKSFLQKDNLLAYSPEYRYKERTVTPVKLMQNGELNYSFSNAGAGATMKVIIELYYYNPFDVSLR